ncbi:hypothetical protein [uncultured Nocardioides sp.]|uniref:hypothetical protein n=1 Tax=uncultured Nocardioides sp. TaxID=198441 RepID=UPI0026378B50|nr:hypothetical protein [uncultured Nocardioides sp.]
MASRVARTLGTAASALLLVACTTTSDAPAPAPAPEEEPSGSIGVYPEPDAGSETPGAIPARVRAEFGATFGTLCVGPQGRPSPPPAPGVRDQASDLRRVGGLTVTRDLTVHDDAAAAGAWIRRLRAEGPCVRVDGLRVTSSERAPTTAGLQASPPLPVGTLVRSQVLGTNGGTDPVLLVDVVSRRGAAVVRTQVMQLSAPSAVDGAPLGGYGSDRVVRRIAAEARDDLRLLGLWERAARRR